MQYVRSLGGSVSKTWNSINPATLSGAIDVVVVEQEDGQQKVFVSGRLLTTRRLTGLLTISCPVWQVLVAKTFGEEGNRLLSHGSPSSSRRLGRVQSQQCQARLRHEIG